MNNERKEEFRTILLKERERIIQESLRAVNGMNKKEGIYADPLDRASLEADRNFQLRLRDRERKLLKKIDEAILRLDNGTYGICESCGAEIEYERLKVRPVTTMCIECKNEQEAEEKKRAE